MAGLVPSIQAEARVRRMSMTTQRRLDGRVKPGQDAAGANASDKPGAVQVFTRHSIDISEDGVNVILETT